MITYEERREVARRLRGQAKKLGPNMDAHEFTRCVADVLDVDGNMTWYEMELRLADLIDPDNIPYNADGNAHGLSGHCDRDALLALADDLDYAGANIENVAYFDQTFYESARRIRDAVDAREGGSDAPAAGDKAEAATDAHADEGEAAEGARTPSIEVLRWVKDNGGIEAVKKRLMPEGMEWPTVDGKPVDFVTGYEPSLGVLEAVSIYSNGACEVMGHDGIIKDVKEIHVATTKVLDADGAECHVGDHGYWLDQPGVEIIIKHIDPRETSQLTVYDVHGRGNTIGAEEFTHRAPVLAADGRPLHEGEHVWHVETGTELVIKELPKPGAYQAVVVFAPPASHLTSFDPDRLTHERSDSWERIEHDARKGSCDYFGYDANGCDGCPAYGWNVTRGGNGCGNAKMADLMRRAKALAGVE